VSSSPRTAVQSPLTEPGDAAALPRHDSGAPPSGAVGSFDMESLRGNWEAQVAEAIAVSPFAIELSALAENELDSLVAYLGLRPKLPFRYLGVHGPSKARRLPEEKMVARLMRLAPEADAIVECSRAGVLGRESVVDGDQAGFGPAGEI
jgi:hypothetical protein